MPWSRSGRRSPQESIHHLISIRPQHCQAYMQADGGLKTTKNHLKLVQLNFCKMDYPLT